MGVRIVIADDSVLVRSGLERLLSSVPDFAVVGVASDLDELLVAVAQHTPDVVVTDIRMPPTGTDEGIRAADELRRSHPDVGVLVLSSFVEPAWSLALLEHGTSGRGYLLKERLADADQLTSAIREIAGGGSVVDPSVVESLVAAKTRGTTSQLAMLSPRERDVLGQIAEGKNNAAIARALSLSPRVVEKHINSLFAKLDMASDDSGHHRVKAVLLYLSDQS